jgi:GT2 family glycosyltransferase
MPDGDFRPKERDLIWGTALLARRCVFERLCGFDGDFFPAYAEDDDLCYRARFAGVKLLYVPRAQVRHMGAASTGRVGSAKMAAIRARNSLLCRWLNFPIPWLVKSTRSDLRLFLRRGDARRPLAGAYLDNLARLARIRRKRRERHLRSAAE